MMRFTFPISKAHQASCRMEHVFLMEHPFKIRSSIVLLNAVFVIYLVSHWAWANESQCDKLMNLAMFIIAVAKIQTNPDVAAIRNGPQDKSTFCPWPRRIASNPPKIGHRVPTFKAYYWTPDFSKIVFRHGDLLTRSLSLGSAWGYAPTSDPNDSAITARGQTT